LGMGLFAATMVMGLAPAAGVAGVAGVAAQPVTLEYRWDEDRPLVYRITQETVADMSGVPGQGDVRATQSQTMRVRMNVIDVAEDGSATIRANVDAVRFEMTPPDGEQVSYDS